MIQTYDIPIFDPDSMDLDEPGETLPKNNSSKEYYIYNTPKTNKFKNTEEKIITNSLNEENKKDDFYLLSKELILSSIKNCSPSLTSLSLFLTKEILLTIFSP